MCRAGKRCLLILIICMLSGWASVQAQVQLKAAAQEKTPERLQLVGLSAVGVRNIVLDESDWSWLRHKNLLRIGSIAPDHPPFSITSNEKNYEGLTADLLGVIGDLLSIKIAVLRYPDQLSAYSALRNDEVDLLPGSNRSAARDAGFTCTEPYIEGQPALVTRLDESRPLRAGLTGMRLAVAIDYLPLARIKFHYPDASIQIYPSVKNAISAVAFGQADVLLDDVNSANYLINTSYSKYLKLAKLERFDEGTFSFMLRNSDQRLKKILEVAIGAIPAQIRANMSRRWGGGSGVLINDSVIDLTPAERRWIMAHPRIRIEVPNNFAPISYFDHNDNYRGVTADILDLIRLRSGLQFDIVRNASYEAALDAVLHGDSQMVAPVNPSFSRDAIFLMTRSFVSSQFVLITKKNATGLDTLQQLSGKRLALTGSHVLSDFVRHTYPLIKVIEARNNLDAMNLVALGKADAAITYNLVADYYLGTVFGDKLRISAALDDLETVTASAGFGVLRSERELHSIINKVLLSIPPDELASIVNRWRSRTDFDNPTWRDYRDTVYLILSIAGSLLLASLIWIVYLRREMQQRQLARRELDDQIRFMEVLINGTPHPIYVRDRAGKMLICNDHYLQALSVRREDMVGTIVTDGVLLQCDVLEKLHADYMQAMATDQPLIGDRQQVFDNQLWVVYHWIQPFKDSAGEVKGVICGWIDVSERYLLMEQLEHAKELADQANRSKTSFLATMSHEIRTPMNAIIGMLELVLRRTEKSFVERASIEVAHESAKILLDLIGDILDIVRIESGGLSLSPSRVNLRELLESVIRVFEGLAREKNLQLKLKMTGGDIDVLVDPLRFKQILSNLLSNAIKFTESGEIKVSVQHTELENHRVRVDMAIEDTGIGISEEDQQRLFQPFSQITETQSGSRGGTGLGLMLCRTLCEMMGGTVTMVSEPGWGTKMTVSITCCMLLPDITPQMEVVAAPVSVRALDILVVDDHAANRSLLCQQLQFLGHQATSASNAQSALDLWRSGSFDIVITDCNMPAISGYELTQAIRSDEMRQQRTRCVVVGLTANALQEEPQRCRLAGMDDCLFKPITLNTLGEKLQMFISGNQGQAQSLCNLHQLYQIYGGDRVKINLLLKEIILGNQADLRQLLVLIAMGDLSGIREPLHRIQGAAKIIDAMGLIDACSELSDFSQQGRVGTELQLLISNLERNIRLLEQTLQAYQTPSLV